MNKQLLEFFGLLLVGDGILTALDPKRHCLLWEVGPKACRDAIDEFAEHPTMSRWAGLGEAIIGALLAHSQKPALWSVRRHF